MTVIIILWSLFEKSKRSLWQNNKWILAIGSLFPIAVLFSFFSLGGFHSAFSVLKSWYWPLIAFPVAVIANDKKSVTALLAGFLAGLIIADGNSYLQTIQFSRLHQDIQFMSDAFRVTSFWDVSRWGFLSGFTLLMLLQFIPVTKGYERLAYGTAFLLTLIPFLVTNTRAPLLAIVALCMGLIFASQSLRKNAFILIFLLIIFAGTIPSYQERFASIFQVQVKEDKLISTNQSNLGRLNMWKVAIDFFKEQPIFGTGFDNSEQPMRTFLQRQNPDYIKSYVSAEFSFSDQHSSYLATLVQFGLLFTICCTFLFLAIFVKTSKALILKKSFNAQIPTIGLAYCFIVFFFYTALISYESALFFSLLSLGVISFSKKEYQPRVDTL